MEKNDSQALESGTYEIIRKRLDAQAQDLQTRLTKLNASRRNIFGAIENKLIANDRIYTENNCMPRDMVEIGNSQSFLFGYNVQMGLRKELQLSDVFSLYRFEDEDNSFHADDLDLIITEKLKEDFQQLYKYYKRTTFSKFYTKAPFLYAVFQVGSRPQDIKAFKWEVTKENKLVYIDSRSEREVQYPKQQEFDWVRAERDSFRQGKHPHVSILDRVFVETVGGNLTIKIDNNTESGEGIYAEPVENPNQRLDDANYFYADLGNLILLKIEPYQEDGKFRYFIFNEKLKEVRRVDAIGEACVLLPDEQGIIFPRGYYLQTGEFKKFDNALAGMHFEKRIISPNGEDFLFLFH
ncbi:MAG: DNA repair ATPase, partial [Bernardetiaceae bacterium]|nr:DNA repair ATPase [Bernardetiaceae bacterium]